MPLRSGSWPRRASRDLGRPPGVLVVLVVGRDWRRRAARPGRSTGTIRSAAARAPRAAAARPATDHSSCELAVHRLGRVLVDLDGAAGPSAQRPAHEASHAARRPASQRPSADRARCRWRRSRQRRRQQPQRPARRLQLELQRRPRRAHDASPAARPSWLGEPRSRSSQAGCRPERPPGVIGLERIGAPAHIEP